MSLLHAIYGRGFGLYGYLAALAHFNRISRILLPLSYENIIESRSDLKQFKSNIIWKSTFENCLESASNIIIATSPKKQQKFIFNIPKKSNKTYSFEKPLASDPLASKEALSFLIENDIDFQINFIFLHCKWFNELQNYVTSNSSDSLSLSWNFNAYHFKKQISTWKCIEEEGGGIIRFYGIHLIAILAKLNFFTLIESCIYRDKNNFSYRWISKLNNKGIDIEINLNSRSLYNEFKISSASSNKDIVNLKTPFDNEDNEITLDPRLGPINRYIQTVVNKNPNHLSWYQDVNNLWLDIEDNSISL